MIKMREEILTLEEVFREESIAVQELIDEKKIELTAYDMREVGYTDLQNDIVMLEVQDELQERYQFLQGCQMQ